MRVFKFKIAGVLAAIAIISLLVSCESFLNGLELKEALNESIEFANAEEVDLSITVDNKHGTLTGAASGTYKVSEKRQYSIAFSESDSSQFFKWKILDASGNESENGKYIKINNPKSTATEFIIVGSANGFTITPYCETRPSIKSATPVYQANGISRDREILVTFDRVLPVSNFYYTESELSALGVDETCTLKKNPDGTIFGYIKNGNCVIKNITIVADYDSENLGKYFSQCYIDGQILHIKPDSDVKNRYEMDIGNIKDIVVTISNICDGEIKMRQNYTWNYRTNPNTDVQAIVKIANSVTTIKCNVGESNELSYTPASEYQFKNWEVWIIDSAGRETQVTEEDKYVSFIDKNNSASPFTILDVPEGTIHLVPNCVECPIVLATTPTNTNAGCYRDEQITVLFDKAMDEGSIYFEEREIPAGKVKIYSTREGKSDKIYAYADSVSEDSDYNYTYVNKVYKNIDIKNLDTQVSLTEYFAEPFFETPSKLIIKTARKTKSDGTSEAVAPPGSCHIIVTISKEMYSMLDGVPIKLPTNKKFNYITNQLIDIVPPDFYSNVQPIVKHKRNNEDDDAKTSITLNEAKLQEMKDILVKASDNKIKMFLCFTDTGSGPGTINMYYKRVFNQNYDSITETEKTVQLTCKYNGTTDGYFGNNFDTATKKGTPEEISLNNLNNGDGVYQICFAVRDVNGNEKRSQNYYILKDTTKPTFSSGDFNDEDFSYSCNTSEKFCKIKAVYTSKIDGGSNNSSELYSDESSAKAPSIKKYKYTDSTTVNSVKPATIKAEFYIEDLAGNISSSYATYNSWTKITAEPKINTDPYNTGRPGQWMLDTLNKVQTSYNNKTVLDYKWYGRSLTMNNNDKYQITGYKLYLGDTYKATSSGGTIKIPYESKRGWKNYKIYPYVTINGKDYQGTTSLSYSYYETSMEWCIVYALGNENDICYKYAIVCDSDHFINDLESSYRKYDERIGNSVSKKVSENAANCHDEIATNGGLTCRAIGDTCSSKGYHFAYNVRSMGDQSLCHIFSFIATQSSSPKIYFTFTKMD